MLSIVYTVFLLQKMLSNAVIADNNCKSQSISR